MRSVTKAAEQLGVSRTKIYSLIEKLDITTKRGSKINSIEDDDFEKMKEIILSEKSDIEKPIETDEPINERTKNVLDRDRNVLFGNVSDREYTDLKERIKQIEQQVDKKDQQLKEQSIQLTEAMKANTTLIESNRDLNKVTVQLNQMVYKSLNPPFLTEDAITIESSKEISWIKRIFKKKK